VLLSATPPPAPPWSTITHKSPTRDLRGGRISCHAVATITLRLGRYRNTPLHRGIRLRNKSANGRRLAADSGWATLFLAPTTVLLAFSFSEARARLALSSLSAAVPHSHGPRRSSRPRSRQPAERKRPRLSGRTPCHPTRVPFPHSHSPQVKVPTASWRSSLRRRFGRLISNFPVADVAQVVRIAVAARTSRANVCTFGDVGADLWVAFCWFG